MKSLFLSIVAAGSVMAGAIALAKPAMAEGESCEMPAESIEETFSRRVATLIEGYEGTRSPMLPEPDAEQWSQLDSPYSAAPGRMRVPRNLVVDKPETRLYVVTVFGDTLCRYRVCASLKRGQKQKRDDWRTPEGDFRIMGIYDSSAWTYKGTRDRCYGPYFISLITPGFMDIGIHGTNVPSSVPGRRSHGCMRMHNEDVAVLRTMVHKDSHIIVRPDGIEN